VTTTGQGTDVAILDDGVSDPDNLHPDLDFATKAIAENGEVTTGTLGSPDNGHGEHVAGTAVGSLEPAGDVPRYSVAPGADLHKINVFQGGAFTSDLVAAVQFSASNGYDVASMSLGVGPVNGQSTIQIPMEQAMQNANDLGTLVIGSAGNSGSGVAGGPTTSPGTEFSGFSVGASNEQRGIAGFSSGTVVGPNSAITFELLQRDGSGSEQRHHVRRGVHPRFVPGHLPAGVRQARCLRARCERAECGSAWR
jgi:hypothetical protein